MPKLIDHTGQVFDRLTVLSQAYKDKHGNYCWNCLCVCGNIVVVRGISLRNKDTKSCGCLNKEIVTISKNNLKHGLSRHPLYSVWYDMNQRCTNPNELAYKDYGGRGIAVCDRWHRDNPEGLKNFIEDMHPTYIIGLEIERIENNSNYSPENCKWSTRKEQSNNTRRNRMITYQGETLTLAQWAENLGINWHTLHHRIFEAYWSLEKAFTTLVKER